MTLRPKLSPLLLMAASLAGCVAYQPAPIDRHAFPQSYAGRSRLLPAGALDEQDLFAFAIAHAPKVHDAIAAYRVAEAAAKTSRVRPLGTLSLTAEYSHQDNPDKPWLGSAQAAMPLDMGARRSGRIGSAGLAVLQARYDYVELLWSIRTAIGRGLADLRSADAELVLDLEAVAIRRDREARLGSRVAAGEDPRSIELLARTDRLAAEKRLADAQGRRAQALEAIGAAIGVPGSALDRRAIAPAPRGPDPAPAAIETWRTDAALARADLLRAVADYDIAEAAVRTEVAKQYPDIQIGPGYTYERGLTKLPFTLSLALPPADFNRSAIREAEARRAAAGSRIESTQAAILGAIDSAQAALRTAAVNDRRITDADVPAAVQAFEQAKHSADAGETDRTDQLAAQAALLDVRIAAIDSRRVHDLALADLEGAVRPPLAPGDNALFQNAMQILEAR